MRDFILSKNPEAMRALYAYEKQHVFLVEGECYKKPRYPNEPDNVRLWLERKEICFTAHSNDFSLLFSDHLAKGAGASILPCLHLFIVFCFIRLKRWPWNKIKKRGIPMKRGKASALLPIGIFFVVIYWRWNFNRRF